MSNSLNYKLSKEELMAHCSISESTSKTLIHFKNELSNFISYFDDSFRNHHRQYKDRDSVLIEEFQLVNDQCHVSIALKSYDILTNTSLGKFRGNIKDINQVEQYLSDILDNNIIIALKNFIIKSYTLLNAYMHLDCVFDNDYGEFIIFDNRCKVAMYVSVTL